MKFSSKYHFQCIITMIVIILISSFGVHFPQSESCSDYPDAIYYNGNIITMDENIISATAVAVKGNLIYAVGSDEEILSLISPNYELKVFNMEGLTMLRGFNDSHSHWLSWRKHICSVSGETNYPSLDEIMKMLIIK